MFSILPRTIMPQCPQCNTYLYIVSDTGHSHRRTHRCDHRGILLVNDRKPIFVDDLLQCISPFRHGKLDVCVQNISTKRKENVLFHNGKHCYGVFVCFTFKRPLMKCCKVTIKLISSTADSICSSTCFCISYVRK